MMKKFDDFPLKLLMRTLSILYLLYLIENFNNIILSI